MTGGSTFFKQAEHDLSLMEHTSQMTEILNRTLFLQRRQVCLLNTEASLEQLVQSILPIFLYILRPEVSMDSFFPFVHKIEKKKKQDELQPLYVELYPPPPPIKQDEEEEPRVIIIQL